MPEPNAGQRDPLLMDTLRDLRSAVDRVQDGQDKMRDRLEAKITETVQPLTQRVTALEQGQDVFRAEVKREARTWGAIGGASAVLTAGLTAVIGVVTKAWSGSK